MYENVQCSVTLKNTHLKIFSILTAKVLRTAVMEKFSVLKEPVCYFAYNKNL